VCGRVRGEGGWRSYGEAAGFGEGGDVHVEPLAGTELDGGLRFKNVGADFGVDLVDVG
jgi:hypothetical protein